MIKCVILSLFCHLEMYWNISESNCTKILYGWVEKLLCQICTWTSLRAGTAPTYIFYSEIVAKDGKKMKGWCIKGMQWYVKVK